MNWLMFGLMNFSIGVFAQCLAGNSPRTIVMDINSKTQSFSPCSRVFPQGVTGFWQPKTSDAREIDNSIDSAVKKLILQKGLQDDSVLPIRMQLLGIIVNGDSLVYINGFPSYMNGNAKKASSEMIDVCDGGSEYWSILWRRKLKTFINPQPNGI